jgi:hypothetical protein
MRTKLIALALAATVAIGSGGVVAAGTSSGTAAEQLPDDYTVDVRDPFDELSSADVDSAIATAWSNEQVRSTLAVSEGLHFEVVGSPNQIEVHVKPGPDAQTEVVAELSPDGTVTEVFEPEVSSENAERVSLVGPFDLTEGNFETVDVETIDEPATAQSGDEYDERLDAEESMTLGIEIQDQPLDDGHLLFNVTTAE